MDITMCAVVVWIVYYSLVTAHIPRLITAIELIKLLLTYT